MCLPDWGYLYDVRIFPGIVALNNEISVHTSFLAAVEVDLSLLRQLLDHNNHADFCENNY